MSCQLSKELYSCSSIGFESIEDDHEIGSKLKIRYLSVVKWKRLLSQLPVNVLTFWLCFSNVICQLFEAFNWKMRYCKKLSGKVYKSFISLVICISHVCLRSQARRLLKEDWKNWKISMNLHLGAASKAELGRHRLSCDLWKPWHYLSIEHMSNLKIFKEEKLKDGHRIHIYSNLTNEGQTL